MTSLIFRNLLRLLLEACQEVYQGRLISLAVFGSVGRGVPRPDSDIDLLIIADPLPQGRIPRVKEFQEVEQRLKIFIKEAGRKGVHTYFSPVFKTPAEIRRGSPLLLDMVDDAQILHDRQGFFAGELENLRERLSLLKAKRVWKGDAWYWDLKPDYQPGEVFEI